MGPRGPKNVKSSNIDSFRSLERGQMPDINVINEMEANKLAVITLDSEELKETIITQEHTSPPGKGGILNLNEVILSGDSQKSGRSQSVHSRRSLGKTEMSGDSDRSGKSARRRSPKSKQGAVHLSQIAPGGAQNNPLARKSANSSKRSALQRRSDKT